MFESFKSLFSRASAIVPSTTYQVASIFAPTAGQSQSVTDTNAMNITTVYACVKVLSEAVSTLPLNLYQDKQGKKEKLYNKLAAKLLRPNSFMTDFDFKSSMMVDLCLRGNSYWQIVTNGLREVTSIYPLDARRMKLQLKDDGTLVYVYMTGKNGEVALNSNEVLHFKMMSVDGLIGISPITYNSITLSSGMSQAEYVDKFYANGANSNILLTHPSILSDEAYARLRDSFTKQYTGVKNSGKPILVEDGVTLEKLSMSNTDSQFIESRVFNKNEIASIFRVPPHMVNEMSRSTFSNIEHQGLSFVKYTLLPYLTMIESELNEKLILNNRQYFKFNVEGLLRGDILSRYQAHQIAINAGWMNRNEIRKLEDLDEAEGLDEFLTPMNQAQNTKDGQEAKIKIGAENETN